MDPLKAPEEGQSLASKETLAWAQDVTKRVNALCNLVVSPDVGALHITDANAMLELKAVPVYDIVDNGVLSTYLVAKQVGPS